MKTQLKCPQCSNQAQIYLESFRYKVYCACCGLTTYLKVINQSNIFKAK